MNNSPLVDAIDRITPWSKGDERAPHKPLLLLYAFGRYANGENNEVTFIELESVLKDLLIEFGPTRQSYHPEYPFWRLQQDRLWEVTADSDLDSRASNTDIPVTELRGKNARGRFPAWVLKELDSESSLVGELAQRVLSRHFNASLHEDIAAAVKLFEEFAGVIVKR
jgi:putative restriction endonuclease